MSLNSELKDRERISDPLASEFRMSCMNAVLFIDYFVTKKNIPLKSLTEGLSVSDEYFRNPTNWLNNLDTYRLYQNTHSAISGYTHKDWKKAGEDIKNNNASGYFKLIARLLPIPLLFKRVPDYNKRFSHFSKYTLISSSPGSVVFKFDIPNPKIKSHYLLGSECFYHLGVLESIPKLQNSSDQAAKAKHEVCSMRMDAILTNCYAVSTSRFEYTKDGLILDKKLIGSWIKLKPRAENPLFLSGEYDFSKQDEANALLITSNISLNRDQFVFEVGEIYNAPYCIFKISYQKSGLWKRIFQRKKISVQYLEDQLKFTEEKFLEADHLRKIAEEEYKRAEIAENKLKEYVQSLEYTIKERTYELKQSLNSVEASKQEAIKANQAKSNFLANISHELRTPMQGILGFSKLGIESVGRKSQFKILEYFKLIAQSGDRLLIIINDLLDISKLESENMDYKFQTARLSAVVEIVLAELNVLLSEKRITVDFPTPEGEQEVEIDFQRISQVIRNLISNAIKFSFEKGRIEIDLIEEANSVLLTVKDYGIGVPAEDKLMIFDKFAQSEKVVKTNTGTGLGLAISKKIINDHQGEIWVEDNENKGSVFKFLIPRIQNSTLP